MARTPVAVHLARVAELLQPLRSRETESLPLLDALDRVTVAEIVSPIALPPFRNSQMDGYAVRAADAVDAPVSLPIVREVAAAPGDPGVLSPGTAVKIMTGAALPAGADAVVPVEDATAERGSVTIRRSRDAGEYVRDAGSDLAAGAVLLPAGQRLAARHLAALAAAGLDTVEVLAQVRIAVVSTGSELVAPGQARGPGQIPDANGTALAAAVRSAGARLVSQARVADDTATLAAVFDEVIGAGAELLVTSGGISMGDHEVVRDLLEPLGAHVDVLAMQPGGPQALATYRGVPVLCFPGNPVSSQLSFELFAAPLLRELAGMPPRRRETRRLSGAVTSVPGRRQFLRGRLVGEDRVATVSGPGSHLVAALAASDVIIDIPEDVIDLANGDPVETWEL
ncbi:MAG TPA: gephyrin-like molybdotransferase Glp [Pseudolysinimonas sp.]|jgi:molybdopterin molybdotransferase|nr:gephyrin-like molybdotransferase Glp [Pseudolysinimonas sp.]